MTSVDLMTTVTRSPGGRVYVYRHPMQAASRYHSETIAGAGDVIAPNEYPDAVIEIARLFPSTGLS